MSTYRIRFRARAVQALPADVEPLLTKAVSETPSAVAVEDASSDPTEVTVESAFEIEVATDKMVDAARDGSRLAKESLWSAGIDAKLVHLSVTRMEG